MMKKIIKTIAIIVVLVFGGAIALLSVQLGGIRAFVVQSASMERTIATGSLAITRALPAENLGTGDIITFIRPDKSREFITHRIVEKFENKGTTVFKTKGDNNNNEDGWLLAEGGVVGKVIFTLPYIGYALSLARTKIGIALLIVVPAVLIIIDEVIAMFTLIRNRKKLSAKTAKALSLVIFVGSTTFLAQRSLALMSDSTTLVENTFSVPLVLPSPTPAPSGCGGNVSIIISGNGAGSNSGVVVNETCTTTSTATSGANITTTVNSQADTGGNQVSGNTGGSTSITTGDASSSASVTNTGSQNQ